MRLASARPQFRLESAPQSEQHVARLAERSQSGRRDGEIPTGAPSAFRQRLPHRVENAPVTILQGHLDMVNENDSDVAHDFSSDPIRPRQEGDWLYATGTTLGSDNGIGVATMLALLEATDVPHGPLELLFTIDEETGLTGASGLDASLLSGRLLINLDSEVEGDVTVGCAGGAGTVLRLPLDSGAATGTALTLRLRGLRVAQPGEFTQRAFLNGQIDLAQAEAIADLIDASTEAAARSASRSCRKNPCGHRHRNRGHARRSAASQ